MAGTALPAQARGPRVERRTKRLVSLLAAGLLAAGGMVAAPLAAQAAETPSFTTEVTEVAGTGIEVQIDGTGYGDVKALPGQSSPGAYFMLVEKGSDLSEVSDTDTAISATIAEDGTIDAVLSVPASELVEGTEYEAISWPNRSFPTEANLFARADVDIDWAALFPGAPQPEPEPQTPSFTAEATEVADTRVDVQIDGTGYGDVQALPGQSAPGAYFMLVEKGVDLADVSQTDTAISATIAEDGTIDAVLSVPASELVEGTEYEAISWPNRSFPTEANLFARADVDIDWAALFPAEEPVYTPELTVTPAADLDPEGDTVTVSGTGYDPAQAVYVFLCTDVELPADLWTMALSCRDGAKQVNAAGGSGTTFDENGAFELELDVAPRGEDALAVYTAANHTAPTDRSQDAKASIAFAAATEPEPEPQTPSFTAEATEVADTRVDVQIDGTGYGDVQALPGQSAPGAYFTLVEKGVDLADVSQTDTAISATIAEDGTIDAVLSVPSSELTEGTEYEVISWPNRSFPTEENLFARADVDIDWAALFPEDKEPAEASVTLLDASGAPVTTVTQGDEIAFALSGAEAGATFSVTVHSDPIVLDDVTTDENGDASAAWTVPADFDEGDHTIEFVDVNAGTVHSAAFDVKAATTDDGGDDDGATDGGSDDDGAGSGSGDDGTDTGSAGGDDASSDDAATTGIGGATADDGTGSGDDSAAASVEASSDDGQLAVTGAEVSGSLIAAAGALALLGAGLLVATRRRAAGRES